MLKPFVFTCLLLAANTCFAQLTTHSTFTLYPIGGKVVQVNPRGVIMSHKGKEGPVPLTNKTKIQVTAKGDTGFVRIGSVLTVEGKIVSKTELMNCSISVHMNPNLTASPGTQTVYSDQKSLTVKGVVTSLNPLVINVIDRFRFCARQNNVGVGIEAPPVPGGLMKILPKSGMQTVGIHISKSLMGAEPGDNIVYYYTKKNPNVAYSVFIRKTEQWNSEDFFGANKDNKGKQKSKQEKAESKE